MPVLLLSAAYVLFQGPGPIPGGEHVECTYSVPVDTMQCIWQRPKVHTHDKEDSSIMRYDMATASQAMFNKMCTDATIIMDDRSWAVHRAVLACASPVFQRMFSSGMQEGDSSLNCVKCSIALNGLAAFNMLLTSGAHLTHLRPCIMYMSDC